MEIEMLDAPEVREEPAAIQQTSIALVQSALVEFDAVAAGLADLKARFGNVIYDVGTTAGMAAAKAARLEIRGPRYAVDKVLKATKEPLNAIKKELDDRASQITAALLEIETPIHEQIKAEEDRKAAEKAERERVAAAQKLVIDNATTWIKNHAINAVGKSAADIKELVTSLETMEVTLETFADRAGEAEQCRLMTLEVLAGLHDAVAKQEAAAARVEAERIRLEQERKELAAAERDAEAKAKALREAEQAKLDAQAEDMARQREAFEAQQAAALAAQQAEAKRLAEQAAELAREQWERQREADIAEGARIWREAGAEQETCPDSSITGKVVDANPDLDPAVLVAADLPVSMEPPHSMDPSDADVIFAAARAVSLEYGLTMGDAIHRLAAVESWTQIEGAAA